LEDVEGIIACFMEVIPLLLEVVSHLEEILAPILREASFRRNYLLK
jgi:hypothetical protein